MTARFLRFLLLALILPPLTVVGSTIAIVWARLTGNPSILYRMSALCLTVARTVAGIRLDVRGRPRDMDWRNTVIASNHLSHLDAPLAFVALGVDFKAITKKEVFRLPFFGKVIELAGFIPLDRRDKMQAHRSIDRAAQSLLAGSCILLFPEGTRSKTGRLGVFKKGGFVAAIEAKSRVIPMVISGSRELMPKGDLFIRPGTIHFQLLDPVDAGLYSYERRDDLVSEVRSRIAVALGEDERTETAGTIEEEPLAIAGDPGDRGTRKG